MNNANTVYIICVVSAKNKSCQHDNLVRGVVDSKWFQHVFVLIYDVMFPLMSICCFEDGLKLLKLKKELKPLVSMVSINSNS